MASVNDRDRYHATPPPRRRSRPITLVLLGAAVLSSCICCLLPAPQADPGPADTGGEFGPQPGTATTGTGRSGTATTARTGNANGEQQAYRRSYIPFWLPLFFPRSGFSSPRGPGGPPQPRQTAPGVSRGGFGRSGFSGGGG